MKKVSILIVTRNRVEQLLRTVELALALPERAPVIVVDNASVDGTARKLKERFPQVKLVRVPFDVGAAARNIGVGCTETPYVAFAHDDTVWEPGALQVAADLLDFYPRIAAISARVLLGPERNEDPVSALFARSPLPRKGLPGPSLIGFSDAASVVRRQAFVDAGGYEPKFFRGGEETLLAYDLAAGGWQMVYSDRVSALRHPPPERDAAARNRLLARNALWTAWLRRPAGTALRQTLACLSHWSTLRTLIDALGGLGWTLHERRVMPRGVAVLCQLLEGQAGARFTLPLPATAGGPRSAHR